LGVIETRHLRVLRAVSRTGSFSAAARELGCTQPAVSQQMKALELAAGTPLVVRAGRETRLTEAGEALTRHAAGILAGLTAAEEEVAALAGLRAGRVRLVSFPSGSSTFVPGAVARMRAEYPSASVSLEEVEPPRSVEMLRSGECEVVLAFRYLEQLGYPEDLAGSAEAAPVAPAARPAAGVGGAGRADGSEGLSALERPDPGDGSRSLEQPDPGDGSRCLDGVAGRRGPVAGEEPGGGGRGGEWDDLVVRPLHTDRLVGLVPSGHRLAGATTAEDAADGPQAAFSGGAGEPDGIMRGRPVRIAEFAGERWIAGCPRCRRHLVGVCESEGFTPRVEYVTDDYPAVAGLVGAGLGVAMLPERALRSIRPEGVAVIEVRPAIRREVVALTLPELARVPAVDGMLAQLTYSARG
jgi:molybdate transport repressor ModE-like protein